MKTIFKFILASLISFFVCYCLESFIEMNLNPKYWSEGYREFCMIAFFLCYLINCFILLIDKKLVDE